MARTFTIKGRIEAEDRASGTVDKVEKKFSGLADTLASRFVVTLGDAERAIRLLTTAFVSSINAAADQQDANNALLASLQNLGAGAEDIAPALKAQANELQRTTTNSDEAITSIQALFATFGVAPSKIEAATLAAANLSAALGIDLTQAATQVAGTFNGVTGRLNRLIPEISSLSDEALRAGGAVKLLNDQLAGRAAAAADSFRGRIVILNNALGEVQETAGGVVVESGAVAVAMDAAAASANAWNAALNATAPTLAQSVTALVPFRAELNAVPDVLRSVVASLKELASDGAAAVRDFVDKSKAALLDLADPSRVIVRAFQEQAGAIDEATAAGERHQAAVARFLRIEEEWAGTLENIASVATRLGVTIDADLNAKLEANRIELEFITEAYNDGILKIGEYQRLAGALAREQAELQAQLNGTAGEVSGIGDAFDAATIAAEAFRAGQASVRSEVIATTQAIALQSRAFDELRRSQGTQAAVDAALAGGGRLVLGGTRVRLAGGGSRLTSSPGLNGGRFA